MHFLVVDDEEDIRVLLEMYLGGRGHAVTAVAEAEAACAAAHAQAHDALLLDVSMPVTDGPSILRRMRAEGVAPARVWLLSALPSTQLSELAGRLDVDFISKPFTLSDLDEHLGPELMH